MNILFITAEIPFPNNSGSRIYTWERIKQLSKYNEVHLVSLRENNEVIEEQKMLNYCNSIKTFDRVNNYKFILKNILKPYSITSRFNIELNKYLKSVCKKYDLIILDSLHMVLNVPFDCVNKIILTQHNLEWKSFKSISKNSNNFIKRSIFFIESLKLRKFEKKLYDKKIFDGYTFISTEDKNEFEKEFKNNNTILINNGMNFKLMDINQKIEIRESSELNIVFSGKMNYEPNVQGILWFIDNIWSNIQKDFPEIKLYIVGKDPVERIKNINENNVVVTGEVKSVLPYLEKATLVIIPLLSGGGVKIKLIEALSTGNLVVTTNKGNEGTKFQDKKHLFVANNIEEFYLKCIDAIKNSKSYNHMITNSQFLLKKEYCWNEIGYNYQKFIEEL